MREAEEGAAPLWLHWLHLVAAHLSTPPLVLSHCHTPSPHARHAKDMCLFEPCLQQAASFITMQVAIKQWGALVLVTGQCAWRHCLL